MLESLPIQFDRPWWLLLLLLIIPCWLLARRSIGVHSRAKAWITLALRVVVVLLLTMSMAEPIWAKRGEGLTVTVLLDRSQSVPVPLKRESTEFLRKAVDASKRRNDRVSVIAIAKGADIVAMPDSLSAVPRNEDIADADISATNLAAGVTLGLATAPKDTANRFLLVSDGNETQDSVLEAAQIARANGIPIDCLLLEYEHRQEVIFERIMAPARARQGQTANIKLMLRSQAKARGTIALTVDDEPLDLNGDEPGTALFAELEAGLTVLPVMVSLDAPGPHRFQAVFEPETPADDGITSNNTAMAVTFVGGEGRILVIDDSEAETAALMRALAESNIQAERKNPEAITGGIVGLAGYDAIILANVPRYAFDDYQQDRDLHAYVHDLGGGLIMLGGPSSFGAGGWIGSEVAKALPVKLDPPQSRQMQRGALALVMHSCEMPQGNFWGLKVAEAAILALSSMDYVGIICFDWQAGNSWTFPMQLAGDKSAPIAAARAMSVGDMPDFDSSMQIGLQGLNNVRAGQKHMIIISDGDPTGPARGTLDSYVAGGITVTTVLVAGHGSAFDKKRMQDTASLTGGRFYEVRNPKNLPQIFIKEAQLVARSLIVEGDIYQPAIVSRLPGPIEGFSGVPGLDGYILTATREGLSQIPIVNRTTEGDDPIYAYWNYGLGKAVAFTSDTTGRWAERWVSWNEFKNFWEQTVRWALRPSSPANMTVNTRTEGDTAIVDVEAMNPDSSFLNFLQTSAVVLKPDGSRAVLPLQQIGPGRYRGQFPTDEAGAYLVNVNYSGGTDADGAAQKGNLQAAVVLPYSPEYRSVTHNRALLKEIADLTGGRMINPNDPMIAELFDPGTLEVPKSPTRIWDLLAILAAALFIVDVAARRVSLDARAATAAALGKRKQVGEQTVAAWKKAKSATGASRTKTAASPEKSTKFEAAEEDQKSAIDVGGSGQQLKKAAPEVLAREKAQAQPGADDDGDYTSRLLRAKRRARREDNPEGESGKEQDRG